MQYYQIRGASADELQRALANDGPASSPDPARHYANCKWHVDWHYTYRIQSGQCALDKLRVRLSAVINFPSWANSEAASPALRNEWIRMTGALRRHEDGHKENGIRVADEIARRMRAAAAEPDCAQLGAKLNVLGMRTIEESRETDAAYDRATNHGVNDGARLNLRP